MNTAALKQLAAEWRQEADRLEQETSIGDVTFYESQVWRRCATQLDAALSETPAGADEQLYRKVVVEHSDIHRTIKYIPVQAARTLEAAQAKANELAERFAAEHPGVTYGCSRCGATGEAAGEAMTPQRTCEVLNKRAHLGSTSWQVVLDPIDGPEIWGYDPDGEFRELYSGFVAAAIAEKYERESASAAQPEK